MIERHGADFTRWRRPRVILLTPNELEPYHIYDRHPEPLKQLLRGGSAQQLADATADDLLPSPSSRSDGTNDCNCRVSG
jgi:hypothetical protein